MIDDFFLFVNIKKKNHINKYYNAMIIIMLMIIKVLIQKICTSKHIPDFQHG